MPFTALLPPTIAAASGLVVSLLRPGLGTGVKLKERSGAGAKLRVLAGTRMLGSLTRLPYSITRTVSVVVC